MKLYKKDINTTNNVDKRKEKRKTEKEKKNYCCYGYLLI